MTDNQYIKAILRNDEVTFTHLYKSCRSRFFGYIKRVYAKNDDYIADLYQDACITLWQNIHKEKLTIDNLNCSLETYLIGIAKYILMARDRKFKEIISNESLDIYHGVLDEEKLREKIEYDRIIESTVKEMGEPCKTLLNKYYWEELSGEEIAIHMNYKSSDTVKTQKYKCMQKLKGKLLSKIRDYKL